MQASTPQEMLLLQKYEAWEQDVTSETKEYALAVHICCNGEDDVEFFRPDFAYYLMQAQMDKISGNVLLSRAWLLWWTRAEQLHRWAGEQQLNAQGSAKTMLQCANANAWYKAWHWAVEEHPEKVGLYLKPARERMTQAMHALKNEKTVLRSILQIALKEEPWYETAKLVDQQNLSV